MRLLVPLMIVLFSFNSAYAASPVVTAIKLSQGPTSRGLTAGSRDLATERNFWIPRSSRGTSGDLNLMAASTVVEQVQVPQCLAAKLPSTFPVLAQNKDFRIISLPLDKMDSLVLWADKVHCGRFINVTQEVHGDANKALSLLTKTLPTKIASLPKSDYYINHQKEVASALEEIKVENIINHLVDLTSFYNRSATTDSGEEAAHWLQYTFNNLLAHSGRTDVTSYFVKTGEGDKYPQRSLVTVIGKDKTEPAIVLGAHMDTLNGRMPGAGDDGSGSASLMEMARILLDSSLEFNRPIYLIWYAAEERGLVGSRSVVADFLKKSIPVQAVIQFDMVGFRNDPTDQTMWVYRDFTDVALSDYVIRLIETYIGVPVGESACKYGCSDHASWTQAGIPAAFPCETNFESHNKKIHTSADTIDTLTPEHMVNFTKLGLAFAIELGLE